ncbi:MAG: hypothetical protein ACK4ZE_13605, partial [Sphingorhabdus sp.]
MAGLGAAICKVPPLMICNPNEGAGSTFPTNADRGKGLKLEAGGGGSWTPGNYGYLDFGGGARDLAEALGANSDVANCQNLSSVSTKPGNNASVTSAMNTRFDIFENGLISYCSESGGRCSPAMNTRKDVLHQAFPATGQKKCNLAIANGNPNVVDGDVEFPNGNNDAWVLPSNFYKANGSTPSNMGLPRDICHAVSDGGTCANGRFGDAAWDRALYFSVNHAGTAASVAQSWAGRATLGELSRYDVYTWEIATSRTGSRLAESVQRLNPQGNPVGQPVNYFSFSAPQCTAGLPASNTQKDRRIVTAAVVNCTANGVRGSTNIQNIENWVDL